MKNTSTQRAAGFTLVELLVSITIMVLLAGIIVGGFAFVQDRQARATAELQIALLSRGIDEYRLDMGVHPGTGANSDFGGNATTAAGLHSRVLYRALFYQGWRALNNSAGSTGPTVASTIYVAELDPINNRQGWTNSPGGATPPAETPILDPWGREYRYRVGDNAVNPDFDLWSSGKDGRTDPGTGGNYNVNADDNKDDIRNF